MADHGVRAAQRRGHLADPQPVREFVPGLPAAMRGHRDDRAEPGALRPRVEQPDRGLMPRMPGQARVVHAAHRRVPGHRGGEQHRGGALAADPQRQRLQPPAEQERLVGSQGPAGVDAHRADLADQARRPGHDPAGRVRVPAQVLGGGVQHQVRAVLQRPADHRGRHGGVHHQQRALAGARSRPGRAGRPRRWSDWPPSPRTRSWFPAAPPRGPGRGRSRPRNRSAPRTGPPRGAGSRRCPRTPRPARPHGCRPR